VFNDAVSTLKGNKYYTTIEVANGYWQIPISEADRPKTALSTLSGSFQFRRLAFPLSNSPASFQKLIDCVLSNVVGTEF
jgi:hypothetical protein